MFCRNCGSPLEEQAASCTACGAPVDAEPAPIPAEMNEVPAAAGDVPAVPETACDTAPETVPAEETPAVSEASAAPDPMPAYDAFGDLGYIPADMTAPAAPPVPPKKKKKRWILPVILGGAGLLILLAVGLLLFLKFFYTPERRLAMAALNTAQRLEEMTDDLDNLELAVKNLTAMTRDRAYESTLETAYDYSVVSFSTKTVARVDGSCTYGAQYTDGALTSEYYADPEALLIYLPERDVTLRLPLKDLGNTFLDSPLAESFTAMTRVEIPVEYVEGLSLNLDAEVSLEDYLAANPDVLPRLQESVSITKTDETVPLASGLTAFRIDLDPALLEETVMDYAKFALTGFLGNEALAELILEELEPTLEDVFSNIPPYLLLGVNKNRELAALHIPTQDAAVTVLLCGSENLWEELRIYVDNELYEAITVTKSEDRLDLALAIEDLRISINDAEGTVTTASDEDEDRTYTYRTEGQTVVLEESTGLGMRKVYTYAPLTEPVTPLDDSEAETLTDMTIEDLAYLLTGF